MFLAELLEELASGVKVQEEQMVRKVLVAQTALAIAVSMTGSAGVWAGSFASSLSSFLGATNAPVCKNPSAGRNGSGDSRLSFSQQRSLESAELLPSCTQRG